MGAARGAQVPAAPRPLSGDVVEAVREFQRALRQSRAAQRAYVRMLGETRSESRCEPLQIARTDAVIRLNAARRTLELALVAGEEP